MALVGVARGRGGLVSVFHEFSAGIGETFILAGGTGRWAIILWGLDTFLMFPNFVSLKSFGNS